jgi:hypothetical protein
MMNTLTSNQVQEDFWGSLPKQKETALDHHTLHNYHCPFDYLHGHPRILYTCSQHYLFPLGSRRPLERVSSRSPVPSFEPMALFWHDTESPNLFVVEAHQSVYVDISQPQKWLG